LLESFPIRGRSAGRLAVATLLLSALSFGCQRVGTSRIPALARYPLSHAAKPVDDSARAELRDRGLRLEFAAHPREVFRDLEAETLARPTARGFLTLGEVAYRIGRRSTFIAARESLEWYRDAAAYASLVVSDPALGHDAILLHNRALAQCLRQAQGDVHRDANAVRERLADAGIVIEAADPDLDPRVFSRLDVAADELVHGLARHDVAGLGVPLLAVRELPDQRIRTGQERFYGDRLVPPLTAVVMPGGVDRRNGPTRIVVFDPITHPSVDVGGRDLRLASDFTTPLAYQAEAMRGTALEIVGAANPERLSEKTGIYLIHPYRPGKIPVLFIHGLVSSPGMWVPMFNELRADPVLRDRYQFWFAYYPSGFPAAVSVAMLRKSLHDLQQTLDPNETDPALRNMVVVGHSMGGLVSRMLIQSSGDEVWNSFFTRPRGQVVLNAEDREWVNGIFNFEPEPAVRRVVFIATPHRGANMANRVIGRVSSALVRRSPRIREMREAIEADNGIEVFQPEYRRRMLSSIDNLEWDSPTLKTLARLPLAPGVPYHSIVGNISHRDDLDRVTDGVVSYESAHFDGAESEVLVPYRHSRCTAKPEPIAEVRRILQLHLGMAGE
jgi:pimeloyl-ACP methyl ester carboxylesterase